jgi:4-diphosphocytidyl-2-C-methyl-D-erythritol kinase
VVRKREDGYHDLETIFYPVYGLYDELEVDPINQSQDHRQNSVEFKQEGLSVDCSTDDNLIIKCYNRMRAKYPQIGDVRIRFKKNIPFGAGLGGGSSDAAHMAIALNEIFNLGLTQEQLAQEVRHLGADCPFFVFNSPCYAEGIGDELTPIDLSLSDMRLVMIKPECGVSTKDAYGGILPKGNSELFRVAQNRLELFGMAYNDFEDTVFAIYPELASIKERLQDAGAIYTAMSGSGSTIYGLFQVDTECTTLTNLRLLHEEFASMIIFDDTLSKTKP